MVEALDRGVPGGVPGGAEGLFEVHAARVMRDLREAFLGLIEGLPRSATRAADIEKALGVSRTLGWQIHRLATTPDPLEAGLHVPGSAAVAQALRGARSAGVGEDRVARARRAMEAFEALVAEHAGDRAAFNTMIGSLAGSEVESIDLRTRREAFRMHSRVWGVQVKTFVACGVVHPGKDAEHDDMVFIRGMHEARWLRQGVALQVSGYRLVDSESRPMHPSDGAGEPFAPGSTLLREFCSPDLPEIETRVEDGNQFAFFRDAPLGNAGVTTVYLADVMRDIRWRPSDGSPPSHVRSVSIQKPIAMLVMDALVHRDTFRARRMSSRVLGSLTRLGERDPSAFTSEDVLPVQPELRHRGRGAGVLGTPHVPRYREMVESVLGRLGWDPEAFDLYRCTLEYPLLSTTVEVRFDDLERGGA